MNLTFLSALVATLILVLHLPDGHFIITADSRETLVIAGKRSHSDHGCKIRILNRDLVFLVSGLPQRTARDKSPLYDAYETAHAVVKNDEHTAYTQHNIDSIADDWASRMKEGIEAYSRAYKADLQPSDAMTAAFLATLGDGTTYGTVEYVNIKKGKVVVIKKPLPAFLPMGAGAATQMALNKSRSGLTSHSLSNEPATALYSFETDIIRDLKSYVVGGPVDELAIGPSMSPLWVHRKPECPED
jgi:hypothetical protein